MLSYVYVCVGMRRAELVVALAINHKLSIYTRERIYWKSQKRRKLIVIMRSLVRKRNRERSKYVRAASFANPFIDVHVSFQFEVCKLITVLVTPFVILVLSPIIQS